MVEKRRTKTGLRTRTARILAFLFLLAGILLGLFAFPGAGGIAVRKIGLPDSFFTALAKRMPYRLGLDIQGGIHLVYQADMSGIAESDRASAMDSVRNVIERRVNFFGVAEPVVQVERAGSDWRLIVELAGVRDTNAAIQLIGQTPFLEFREERPAQERDAILAAQKNGERANEDPYFIPTNLTGRYLQRAEIIFNQTTSQPQVSLQLTGEGGNLFAELTKRNVGKRVAIYLDGVPISEPVVQEEIAGGKAQITGNFTPQEAKDLVERLNAGALPVPIHLIGRQSVEASLGSESLARSMLAGMIGFLAVAAFMIFWYRLPGVLAVLALLLYIAIVLSVFKLIPVTLTIAGIAGFILSVGMAVDANILIFERMKEELAQGKVLDEAIREGFSRAWTSIRDSNVSSLITSAILYWLGSSVVQGFALTLIVGILISMFSAISVTRTLLFAVASERMGKLRNLFLNGFSKNSNMNLL